MVSLVFVECAFGICSPGNFSHFDNWQYLRNITLYIFCISILWAEVFVKIGDEIIDIEQGLLFNFYPLKELHEFVNNTDRDFYFCGFDYWILIIYTWLVLEI